MKKFYFLSIIIFVLLLSSCKDTESEFKSIDGSDLTGSELYMILTQDSTNYSIVKSSITYDALYTDNIIYLLQKNPNGEITAVLKRADNSGAVNTLVILIIMLFITIVIIIIINLDE